MKWFYLFIFSFVNAFSFEKSLVDDFLKENEPNPVFEKSVNVINGSYIFDDEIVALGKENIKISLQYLSLNNVDVRAVNDKNSLDYIHAGWSFHDLFKAYNYGDRIDIAEENGAVNSYSIPPSKTKKKLFESKNEKKKRVSEEKNEKEKNIILSYAKTTYLPKAHNEKKLSDQSNKI